MSELGVPEIPEQGGPAFGEPIEFTVSNEVLPSLIVSQAMDIVASMGGTSYTLEEVTTEKDRLVCCWRRFSIVVRA